MWYLNGDFLYLLWVICADEFLLFSSFVARLLVHLASEKMLRALNANMTICFVDLYSSSETFVDFLCQADLFLWHEFVGEALGFRAFSSLLGLGSDHFLGRGSSLSRSHGSFLGTSRCVLIIFSIIHIHVIIRIDRFVSLASPISTSSFGLLFSQLFIIDRHLIIVIGVTQDRPVSFIQGVL